MIIKQRTGQQKAGLQALINDLPDGLVMAEIGCYAGESTQMFADSGKIKHIYAIDPWYHVQTHEAEVVFDRVAQNPIISKCKGTISDWIDKLPALDMVYIDGDHTYDAVKNDIKQVMKKLKPDGILAGHDYGPCYKNTVVKAVHNTVGVPDKTYKDSSFMIHSPQITPGKITISVAIMARNSDDVIGRCLESVKDADEIIVVDTGSDDTTKEIALQYTDKVYDFWECNEGGQRDGLFMDFALARNEVLRHCTMTHVLTIDCDEVLSPGGLDYLRRLDHDAVAVWCVRGNDKEKHQQPRFYANKPDIYWRGAAHNYLVAPPGVWTDAKDVNIRYHTNKQRTKIDPDRTIRILSKFVKEHPRDCAREMYYLAKEHQSRSRFAKALKLYAKYVRQSDYLPEKADAFIQMARCYIQLKMYKDATNTALAAMNINPDFSEAYRILGDLTGPATRVRYQKMAAHATDTGVLFVRNDNRMKVTILTPLDAGDIAHTIMHQARFYDPHVIDIEAVAMQSSGLIPSIISCGVEVVQDRVNRSDIIHFISNTNHKRDFYGIHIPQGKKIIYTQTSDNPEKVHAKLITHTQKDTPVSEFTTVNNIGQQWHEIYDKVRS